MFKALDAVKLLRVSKEGELEGLDLDQHGNRAYPEYVVSTLTASHGISADTDGSIALPSAEVAAAK